MNKTDLRHSLMATRHAIPVTLRTEWDAAITLAIHAWIAAHPVKTLGVYWPIRGEPDIRPMYSDLARQGVRLALPVVHEQDAPLTFAPWAPGETLVKDAHGVLVPETRDVAILPDALLIPCVGFTAGRMRLGYGAGYYDRTLATTPRPITLGVAYACLLTSFEAASHDIALDVIITETSGMRPDVVDK